MESSTIIKAQDLNEEIIKTLPAEVTNYKHEAHFVPLGGSCNGFKEIHRLDCRKEGEKIVIVKNVAKGTLVFLATIKKADRLTIEVEYTDHKGKLREDTIHTTGSIDGDTEVRPTHILRYIPNHFEQMKELNDYRMKGRNLG